MFGTNKPAYNKPGMKPMKPTGGPMPMFPGNKPSRDQAFNRPPMVKPSKDQQSLDAIKRRLSGM